MQCNVLLQKMEEQRMDISLHKTDDKYMHETLFIGIFIRDNQIKIIISYYSTYKKTSDKLLSKSG